MIYLVVQSKLFTPDQLADVFDDCFYAVINMLNHPGLSVVLRVCENVGLERSGLMLHWNMRIATFQHVLFSHTFFFFIVWARVHTKRSLQLSQLYAA